MFLAIDVGNTEIVYGVMDENSIMFSSRLATDRRRTSDEYAVLFRDMLHIHGISTEDIEGGIISSVVPPLKARLRDAVYSITGKQCMVVGPGLKNGLRIRLDDPAELGADQVCAAVAASAEYDKPIAIFDMGTATTVSVIDHNGDYLGGMIIPGVELGLDALCQRSSLLPQIDLDMPPAHLIGANTEECMKSGVIFGNASMIDGLIDRISDELGEEPTVVMTGDVSCVFEKACRHKLVVEPQLMLKGLRIIYLNNRKKGKGSRQK
jgi:type III pantothenate kinase